MGMISYNPNAPGPPAPRPPVPGPPIPGHHMTRMEFARHTMTHQTEAGQFEHSDTLPVFLGADDPDRGG